MCHVVNVFLAALRIRSFTADTYEPPNRQDYTKDFERFFHNFPQLIIKIGEPDRYLPEGPRSGNGIHAIICSDGFKIMPKKF
jgi:hypothetical protein